MLKSAICAFCPLGVMLQMMVGQSCAISLNILNKMVKQRVIIMMKQ